MLIVAADTFRAAAIEQLELWGRRVGVDVVKQREGAVDVLTGPTGKVDFPADFVEDVRQALYASKIVAYAQGFDQIAAASAEYDWNIDLGSCSALWRAGCIIRSEFLDEITSAFTKDPHVANLIVTPAFAGIVKDTDAPLRRVVSYAVLSGLPVSALASALGYFDSYRRSRGTANLIQAQRDFFGAHGFDRIDGADSHHGPWGSGLGAAS